MRRFEKGGGDGDEGRGDGDGDRGEKGEET